MPYFPLSMPNALILCLHISHVLSSPTEPVISISCINILSLTRSLSFLISAGVRQSALAISGTTFTLSCRAFMNSMSTGRSLGEVEGAGVNLCCWHLKVKSVTLGRGFSRGNSDIKWLHFRLHRPYDTNPKLVSEMEWPVHTSSDTFFFIGLFEVLDCAHLLP